MADLGGALSRRRFLGILAAGAAVPVLQACEPAMSAKLPTVGSVVSTMRRVNDAWMGAHPGPGTVDWARSTYMSGHVALHRLTGDVRYRSYAEQWAEAADYRLDGPTPTRDADHQCAGQVFNDLYELAPDPAKVASIDEAVMAMVEGPPEARDDWRWVDALHMAMPSFVRAGHRQLNDPACLTTLHELYRDTRDRRGLWRPRAQLWYRDIGAKGVTSPSGLPVLWSRGNGWAIAAHAKTLALLPADDLWPIYDATLVSMSEAVRTRQRSDGFWNMNLADAAHTPGRETSATALFAFGMAYGIRSGRLDHARFAPVVARAWNGMATVAVQPDGRVGYMQGVANGPGTVAPTADSTAEFGVGAFLLAGCELVRMLTEA